MTTPRPTQIPNLTFNDGTEMPQLGLGTYKLRGEECVRVIREAINLGYRHIDTASIYENEEEVGQAIAEAIAAGDVSREELFITTKVWNDCHGAEKASASFQDSLRRLGLDYIDLFLVHWPCPQQNLFVETFEAIAKIQGLGSVQSIGVANFYEEALREIVEKTGITPVLNQVELHPGFTQAPLRAVHEELGIITEAWSPLSRGIALQNPIIEGIAAELGVTPAQVTIKALLQLGCSVIPKTANPQRLQENLEALNFGLSQEQLDSILALDDQPGFGRIFKSPWEFPGA